VSDEDGIIQKIFVYDTKSHVADYMITASADYQIITDHLGSPVVVVNAATGEVVQEIRYDSFGNVISDSNPAFIPFGYAGCLYDQDTKLCRFGARDYDASIGRWTAKDPILFAGGDANLYGYVENDPVNWIDSEGNTKKAPGDEAGYGGGGGGGRSGNTFYVAPNGQAAYAPPGSKVYPTSRNTGLIIDYPKGGNISQIRLMDPVPRNPNGYGRMLTPQGRYTDPTGRLFDRNDYDGHDLPPQIALTQKFTILLKLTKRGLLNEKVKIYRAANCHRPS
jgi:RHS repeat-associated protein